MKISPIIDVNNNNKNICPNFGTSKMVRVMPDNSILCNITWPFRECLNWKAFVNLLDIKYKYEENVNILNLACSDGSESITLLASLYEFANNNASKFLPIKASDITKKVIDSAKSGIYNIEGQDLRRINTSIGHYSKYFCITESTSKLFPFAMKLLPKYTDKIIYEQLDIFDSLKKLQPQNNVVLCRNVLPYLSNEKRVQFIDLLARKLDPSSLVVIGAFDNGHYVNNLLKSRYFKQTTVENVYSKY
jgi:chemotaxis methyl-accepting protein methylase